MTNNKINLKILLCLIIFLLLGFILIFVYKVQENYTYHGDGDLHTFKFKETFPISCTNIDDLISKPYTINENDKDKGLALKYSIEIADQGSGDPSEVYIKLIYKQSNKEEEVEEVKKVIETLKPRDASETHNYPPKYKMFSGIKKLADSDYKENDILTVQLFPTECDSNNTTYFKNPNFTLIDINEITNHDNRQHTRQVKKIKDKKEKEMEDFIKDTDEKLKYINLKIKTLQIK